MLLIQDDTEKRKGEPQGLQREHILALEFMQGRTSGIAFLHDIDPSFMHKKATHKS